MTGPLEYPERSELVERLRWFVQLRWIAAVSVVLVLSVVSGLLLIPLDILPLLGITAAIAAYNLFFWAETRVSSARGRTIERAVLDANLQISLDLVALTALLHFSGGIENPFYLFYLFHIIIASILLSAASTFAQSTLAVCLFGGLAWAEYAGIVPHVGVPGLSDADSFRQPVHVAAQLTAFVLTMYIAAYLATTITGRLRQRERRIIELHEQLNAEEGRLQTAYAQLQETERTKSRFMRKVSHELRAPLAAVESLLATVLQGYVGALPPESRELLERASTRTKGLLAMVNDLLVLSRMREARLTATQETVPVGQVAADVVALVRPQAEQKGLTLEASIPHDLPGVRADRVSVEELLSNLLSNAIRYTPGGGTVRVELQAAGGRVELRVSDTGIGISREELDRVFEEYYRSERARAVVPEGTGLGLSIVKAIVERLGGQIEVESQPGKGTAFVVRLPTSGTVEEEGAVEDGGLPARVREERG